MLEVFFHGPRRANYDRNVCQYIKLKRTYSPDIQEYIPDLYQEGILAEVQDDLTAYPTKHLQKGFKFLECAKPHLACYC